MKRMPLKEAKDIFIKRSFYIGIITILICWFMKLFGIDIFELDLDNKFFNDLDKFMTEHSWVKQVYYSCTLYLQMLLLNCIVQREKAKDMWKYTLITIPIIIILRVFTSIFETNLGNIAVLIEFIFMVLISSKFKCRMILRSILIVLVSLVYQIISLQTRSVELQAHTHGFIVSQILSIDYYMLLYLHKEVAIMNDGTLLFFGLTAWLYAVAGFIVGIFTLHPIKKAKEYYAKGKAKEDARKTKKATIKTAKAK